MANNFYAGFNPDLLRPGFMPKIPETLTPSPRTQSPLGPFINPGIGQAVGQAVQQYQPAPQPQSMGSRIQGILGTLLGAQDRTELSKGLLDFGARMMAASAPGPNTSFLGALGQSLPGTRQSLEQNRQMAALDQMAQGAGLGGLPPQMQMQMLMRRTSPQVLPYGSMMVDETGNVIAANQMQSVEESWKGPSGKLAEAYSYAAADPSIPAFRQPPEVQEKINEYLLRDNGSAVTVNLAPTEGSDEFMTKLRTGKAQRAYQLGAQAAGLGDGSGFTIQDTRRAIQLLSEDGVNTGPGTEVFNRIKSGFGTLLGASFDSVANYDELSQRINSGILDKAQFMKGALSDNDIKFLKASFANLGNSTQGNLQILRALELAQQKQINLMQDMEDISDRDDLSEAQKTQRIRQLIREYESTDLDFASTQLAALPS